MKLSSKKEIRNKFSAEKREGGVAGPEIFGGFRGNISEELHFDTTSSDGTDGNIEEDDWVFWVWWSQVPLHAASS